MRRREALTGLLFCLPFLIGIVFFLASPLLQSLMISFGDIRTENGYDIVVQGPSHYLRAFTEDADYIKYLLEALQTAALYISLPRSTRL